MRRTQHRREVGGFLAGRAEHPDVGGVGHALGARRGDQAALIGPSRQPVGDAARRGQQHRPRPTGDPEGDGRHLATAPEPRVDVTDRGFVGPAEGVDRLIGIADEDQLVGPGSEHGQQFGLGRVGVLVFVDQDVPPTGPLVGQQAGIVREGGEGRPDELGRVVTAGSRQRRDVVVLGEEPPGRHPVRPATLGAQRHQRGTVETAFHRAHQQIAELGGERPGAQRRPQLRGPAGRIAPGHQLAEDDVLLRARQ